MLVAARYKLIDDDPFDGCDGCFVRVQVEIYGFFVPTLYGWNESQPSRSREGYPATRLTKPHFERRTLVCVSIA